MSERAELEQFDPVEESPLMVNGFYSTGEHTPTIADRIQLKGFTIEDIVRTSPEAIAPTTLPTSIDTQAQTLSAPAVETPAINQTPRVTKVEKPAKLTPAERRQAEAETRLNSLLSQVQNAKPIRR